MVVSFPSEMGTEAMAPKSVAAAAGPGRQDPRIGLVALAEAFEHVVHQA